MKEVLVTEGFSSHLREGHPVMADVSGKQTTLREAAAEGFVNLTEAIARAVEARSAAKGDVLKIAELAGIMAAKRVPELIPLCHPIRLDDVRVECRLNAQDKRVRIQAFVKASEVTGVEMEALTGVSVAALTIYDMCKGIDKGMSIEGVRLLRKSGGKSGDYTADPQKDGGKGIVSEKTVSPAETRLERRPLRAAVLTVSDKGSRGEREDTAGPALCDLLRSIGAEVAHRAVVPDERAAITEVLETWSEDVQLILTTGGTGLSLRDVTPDALEEIADRVIPGFGELMRAESLKHTPHAPLSRGLAVTRGRCFIMALPGSRRGAEQCFEAVRPALRHAVGTLNGWDEDSECGSS
ncbi:MAG: bifunctional molybdenum cofactor biosynthesis protein MoaC/MoaB [Synergistaceae bacterium]|nr:bifunctional molybdenum cofactor biosynthesis protein MoaC/MoaB [Synergistaceae bacterium]